MIAITTVGFLVVATATTILAMCSAYCARTPPRLAFARGLTANPRGSGVPDGRRTRFKKSGLGLLSFLRCDAGTGGIEPLYAPSWPGYGIPALPPLRPHLDPLQATVEDESCGMKPYRVKVEEQVYVDCLDSFEACKDRHRALALKIALMARYPGHRGSINRAFRDVYDA